MLGMMNGDGGYCRIIRQFLAIYFAAYADTTEIYVERKQESDTVFNCYCKNIEDLVIYCGNMVKWKGVLTRDESGI